MPGVYDGGLSPAQASCASDGRALGDRSWRKLSPLLHHEISVLNAAFYPRLYTHLRRYFTKSVIQTAALPLPLLMKVGVGDPE